MNFKRVLKIFILFLLTTLVSLVFYVQTSHFSSHLQKVINKISKQLAGLEMSFDSLSLNLFPLGIGVNNLHVKKTKNSDNLWEFSFGKVGYYLTLFESNRNKIFYGKIYARRGDFEYQKDKKSESLKDSKDSSKLIREVLEKSFKYQDFLPFNLDILHIKEAKVSFNQQGHSLSTLVNNLRLYKNKEDFLFEGHFMNTSQSFFEMKNFENEYLDELEVTAKISLKKINIEKLLIKQDVHLATFQGEITHYDQVLDSHVKLTGETFVFLNSLASQIKVLKKQNIKNGVYHGQHQLELKKKRLIASSEFSITNFQSKILHAKKITGKIDFKNNRLHLSHFDIVNDEEILSLLKPTDLYDLTQDKILVKESRFQLENFSLSRGLYFLGDHFQILQGSLTGELSINLSEDKIKIIPHEKFLVNHFSLTPINQKDSMISDSIFHILQLKPFYLNQTLFEINLKTSKFMVASKLKLPHSILNIKGSIENDRINFILPQTMLDLSDFINISDLFLKGKGPLSLKVQGDLQNTVIKIVSNLNHFQILGYSLGQSVQNVNIYLDQGLVEIKKFHGQLNNSFVTGNGFVNYDNQRIDLSIHSKKISYPELNIVLKPIFSNLTFLPQDLSFESSISTRIHGHYQFDQLKVDSTAVLKNITVWGEDFEKGQFDLKLENEELKFLNTKFKKGPGYLGGTFNYHIPDEKFDFQTRWMNFDFQGFNFLKFFSLHFNGVIQGKASGKGSIHNPEIDIETYVRKSTSGTYNFRDSFFNFKLKNNIIQGATHIFKDTLKFQYLFPLNFKGDSQFNLNVSSQNPKPLFALFLGRHIENESIQGELNFSSSLKFKNDFKEVDFRLGMKSLKFFHPDFNVNYENEEPQLIIQKSQVKKWALKIDDEDFMIKTKGNGFVENQFSLIHELIFDAKIAKILFPFVLSSNGVVSVSSELKSVDNRFRFYSLARGENLTFSINNLPSQISNFDFDIELVDKKLFFNKLMFNLDKGRFLTEGDILFDDLAPDVNIRFFLDNIDVPLFGQSKATLDGEGVILGNHLPYTFSGDFSIDRGEIINELNEFSRRSSSFSQVRFMPSGQKSILGRLLRIDLGLKTNTALNVTNSLMNLKINGDIRLTGDPMRPQCEGKLTIPSDTSSVFFKNNEYKVLSGEIIFDPKKDILNPRFDIKASTTISNYKIFPKFYGELERFSFDLSSEPLLPRDSILSLIAFGYTSEIQGNLDARDQQSLTQVGVGSFIFDRFKLSDILNKQFGLQINLGTVFEQSPSESLLSGRSQDSGGTVGRTRSATKIELKKKLDEEVTLSVSSTMGGSIGQRQSMNLNYGITDSVQLEGVYELRTNEEGDSDIIYNSIGGDLKFRRTFK